MTTIFLIITLFLLISITINIFTFKSLLKKQDVIELYADWILEVKQDVENVLSEMREIDKRGTFATSMNQEGLFESDDEVGRIFKEMIDIIEKLNHRIQ
jgi:hypothetical protein